MILWRVSNYENLDGVGGLFVSGRWHTKGREVVYCTLNPATALLADKLPERFQVLRIEGRNTLSLEKVEAGLLSPDWAEDSNVTQSIGDRWLLERRSLLLQVPSVLVPETWNILVNPRHAEAPLLKITMTYEHAFDSRLLRG